MRSQFCVGSLLFLVLVSGCQKAGPTPAPKPATTSSAAQSHNDSTSSATSESLPVLTDDNEKSSAQADAAEMPPPDEGKPTKYSPEREAELLAKLAKDPKDVEILQALAKSTQLKATMTETGEPDYELFKKSAGYLHQALEVEPKLAKSDEFKLVAASYFYNEACALSRDKQDEAGLKVLQQAVNIGWIDTNQLKSDPDLEHLRQKEGFAPILKMALEQRKAAIGAAVDSLFAEKNDFTFDFDLKDTEGEPLTKKAFEGKVLMVNVWGTWCPPCRRELPDLAAAYAKYKSQGFEIVGLNTEHETGDEANALIKESQKKFGINYRCALGDDTVFEQIPDHGAVPTTLLFDPAGKVRLKLVGMADEILLEVIIERMLKDYPPTATEKTADIPK